MIWQATRTTLRTALRPTDFCRSPLGGESGYFVFCRLPLRRSWSAPFVLGESVSQNWLSRRFFPLLSLIKNDSSGLSRSASGTGAVCAVNGIYAVGPDGGRTAAGFPWPGLSFPCCFGFPCLIRLSSLRMIRLSYLRPIRFSSLCPIPLSLPDIKIRAENLEKCQKIQVCACPDDRNI